MRFATKTSIAFFYLTAGAQIVLSAPLVNATAEAIHEAVLAMMAGYFEGDIVLPEDGGRSAWDEPPKPWPDATIPYEVDPRLARDEQFIVLEKAMKMIQIRTCLRFVKRSSERDYIYLFPGEGCYSYVGYQGMGEQVVSLGKGCLYLGTALHELLHAAGFHHEHTRYDRDDYLKINMENVIPEYRLQFKKRPESSDPVDTRFDTTSVMLYGSTSFAKDKSHPTILRKNGDWIEEVYKKYSLSLYDRIRVNIFYDCKGQIRGNTK